jgi:hypothetical protein
MSWAGTALISRYYAWSRHTNVPMEKRCKEVDSRSRALAICGRLYLGYPGGHNGKIVLLETATDAGHPKLPSEKLWRKGQASKTGNVLIVIATSQPTRLLVTVNRAWHGMSVCGTFYTYPHAHSHMHTCTHNGSPEGWIWTFIHTWQTSHLKESERSAKTEGLYGTESQAGRCSAGELRAPGVSFKTLKHWLSSHQQQDSTDTAIISPGVWSRHHNVLHWTCPSQTERLSTQKPNLWEAARCGL